MPPRKYFDDRNNPSLPCHSANEDVGPGAEDNRRERAGWLFEADGDLR
jgi:hypothetical protein